MDDIAFSAMTEENEIDFLRDKSSHKYVYDKTTIDSLKKRFALEDS